MGMYTELVMNVSLKLPPEALEIMEYMCALNTYKPSRLPGHPLFETDRWDWMLRSCSCYFVPESHCSLIHQDLTGTYVFMCRCDLKNYTNEIGHFIDWLDPYVDEPSGHFLGYHRYEENDEPTLIYKK